MWMMRRHNEILKLGNHISRLRLSDRSKFGAEFGSPNFTQGFLGNSSSTARHLHLGRELEEDRPRNGLGISSYDKSFGLVPGFMAGNVRCVSSKAGTRLAAMRRDNIKKGKKSKKRARETMYKSSLARNKKQPKMYFMKGERIIALMGDGPQYPTQTLLSAVYTTGGKLVQGQGPDTKPLVLIPLQKASQMDIMIELSRLLSSNKSTLEMSLSFISRSIRRYKKQTLTMAWRVLAQQRFFNNKFDIFDPRFHYIIQHTLENYDTLDAHGAVRILMTFAQLQIPLTEEQQKKITVRLDQFVDEFEKDDLGCVFEALGGSKYLDQVPEELMLPLLDRLVTRYEAVLPAEDKMNYVAKVLSFMHRLDINPSKSFKAVVLDKINENAKHMDEYAVVKLIPVLHAWNMQGNSQFTRRVRLNRPRYSVLLESINEKESRDQRKLRKHHNQVRFRREEFLAMKSNLFAEQNYPRVSEMVPSDSDGIEDVNPARIEALLKSLGDDHKKRRNEEESMIEEDYENDGDDEDEDQYFVDNEHIKMPRAALEFKDEDFDPLHDDSHTLSKQELESVKSMFFDDDNEEDDKNLLDISDDKPLMLGNNKIQFGMSKKDIKRLKKDIKRGKYDAELAVTSAEDQGNIATSRPIPPELKASVRPIKKDAVIIERGARDASEETQSQTSKSMDGGEKNTHDADWIATLTKLRSNLKA